MNVHLTKSGCEKTPNEGVVFGEKIVWSPTPKVPTQLTPIAGAGVEPFCF